MGVEEAFSVDDGSSTAYRLKGTVQMEHRLSWLVVVLPQFDRHNALVGEALTEEVYGVAVRSGRLEARIVFPEVSADEEDIIVEQDVAPLGMYGLGQALDVRWVYQREDRTSEGFGLPLTVGDEVGDKECVIDGEGDITGEDLIVVLERRWA